MEIRHLGHSEIDKIKWDETIRLASNGNIYAYSWYLDVVCPKWEALVSHDYRWILPLTGNKKFGISYLFRPMLSQQLGLFSISPSGSEELGEFLDKIPSKYRLIQYCLNKSNDPGNTYNPTSHKSFELDLSSDYKILKSAYKENHKRNLKKASKNSAQIVEEVENKNFFELLSKDISPGSRILSGRKNLTRLKALLNEMQSNDAVRIIGMKTADAGLVSAVLFGKSHNTWYYLVPVSSPAGKENRALFSIIDHLIESRSGSKEILDFEGSNIPGLAQFYSGFGASEINYYEIRINRLPWPINYLK